MSATTSETSRHWMSSFGVDIEVLDSTHLLVELSPGESARTRVGGNRAAPMVM